MKLEGENEELLEVAVNTALNTAGL